MDPNINLNEFFNAAKGALNEAGALSAQASELKKALEAAEKNVNSLKKEQSEQITQECNRRRGEIDDKYDKEIEKYEVQLSKAKKRREKAKDQGVKERIAEETADLKADIKAITARTKADFKANNVPDYCESGFFNALYFPSGAGDVVVIILTFIIAFFVIPFGIYKLFFDGSTVALIIIYVLDVLIFGGLYVGISRRTVMEHTAVLRQANNNRKAIEADQKKIKAIIRQIEDDKSESCYDLAKYDDDIAHIKQQLANVTMTKNDAVNTFENVTMNIIVDEITTTNKPAIDEAEKKLADATARFTQAEAVRKAKVTELTNDYEPYLGREFMNITKIDRLQDIINHGTATNISEAIEEYNRQYDI